MTDSPDNNHKGKKPKAKGPIRLEAVLPAGILTALLVAYFALFFDGHLRRGLEYVATQVNGAEVNIGHLRTHFLGASLEIGNIQVTDKNHPERNILEVGKIHFKMLWDGLLRAKVVVDDASILNIQALTPRARPGYVVPPSPPSKGPSALEKVEHQVLEQTRKNYNENFLGDIATVLGGGDYKEQLKNIEGNLKSEARIKELQKELADKKVKWEQKIKALPQAQDFKPYQDRIKALKFDLHNPSELAKNLKEADQIRKELSVKAKEVDQTTKELKDEINTYSNAYKDLEKLAQEDMKSLQARLKIPNIDAKEFSQQLFLQMIEQKLGSFAKYVEVARKYMPPPKPKGAEEKNAKREPPLVPPKRGQGVNYHFPITTGYPTFWLKHAAISSELGQSEYSGNIKGEIKDINTDPSIVGRPTILQAQGDFPKQGISGLDARISLDHTTSVSKDTMNIHVAGFPVSPTTLSGSPDLTLGLKSAKGASQLEASLVDGALLVDIKNVFNDIQYDLSAKNTTVKEIVDHVLKGIPTVNVNAEVKGTLSKFDIHINSNLGDELAKGFQKQLQAKIDEAKGQLSKLINERIGGQKDQLKQQLDQTLGPVTKDLEDKKSQADKAVKDASAQSQGPAGGGAGNAKDKLQEEGKKLLKKFGF